MADRTVDAAIHVIRPPLANKELSQGEGIFRGSEMIRQPKKHVQDPYSFVASLRCWRQCRYN